MTTRSRLGTVSPELAGAFGTADQVHRRRMALVACEMAVAASGLTDNAATSALRLLRDGLPVPGGLLATLQARAAELDDHYLELWRDGDCDEAMKAVALRHFSMARAATALNLVACGDADQFDEAAYEAIAAVPDSSTLIECLYKELSR